MAQLQNTLNNAGRKLLDSGYRNQKDPVIVAKEIRARGSNASPEAVEAQYAAWDRQSTDEPYWG